MIYSVLGEQIKHSTFGVHIPTIRNRQAFSRFSGTFIHLKNAFNIYWATAMFQTLGEAATNQIWPQFFQNSQFGAEEKWTGNESPCVIKMEGAFMAQRRNVLTRLGNDRGRPEMMMFKLTAARVNSETDVWALIKKVLLGLPWWHSGWESACQCRGHGFEPWSGKIPQAAERLGPWATIAEPARLEPVLRNKRGHDSERPVHCDEEWSPLAATRESPRTETKTQHSHK